jgi:dTDP-4-amino-4,6-dideoxygalactose transaminase
MSKLALFGGRPVFDGNMAPFNTIGPKESELVNDVLSTGLLSGFVGGDVPDFNGGPYVQRLESEWKTKFKSRHAVSVNSATSGLFAAMGAVGVSPGDEVILPPYTMSATAMAPLVYGGIPVFVDIESDTFCLDVAQVEAAITPRTRAIIAVNLFGHPAELHALLSLADRHGIYLIEDNAQAPLAKEHGKYTGTIGHIGVFSLNRHKHIQTGEGALCTTNDDTVAERLRLIRNHGENLVEPYGIDSPVNLVGYNFRLTELSAAVGVAQLSRGDEIIEERCRLAEALTAAAQGVSGFTPPKVREGCTHTYYGWTAKVDEEILGVSRALLSRALEAEGFVNSTAYVAPLYLLPVFQKRIAIGRDGWPFTLTDRSYERGMCPVTERMHYREVLEYPICAFSPTPAQVKLLTDALHKVFDNIDVLRSRAVAAQ